MPNRIIKESICDSERLAGLSDFEFRLWVGLIVSADDAGRGDARPAIIKGHVFPLRERIAVKDIDAALHALAAAGCVSLYVVGGKPYFQFPNWARHQRIRDCKPKYPGEDEADDLPQVAASCGELPQVAASCGEPRRVAARAREESNPIRIQSESKSESNPIQSKCSDIISRYKGDKDELLGALKRFSEMRVKIRKPLTDAAKEMLLKKLAEFPEEQWVAILDQSVLHCWQGVFPLKDAPKTVQSVPKAKGNAVEYEESHRKLDDYALAAIRRAMAEEA